MKAFLSIFLCFTLLLGCFAMAEPTDTAVSKQLTISDISVRIGSNSYELPLEGKIGYAAGDDGILFDIGLDYNSDTLFPIQAKLTQDSLSLLIGKSSTAYVFASALLSTESASWNELINALTPMVEAASAPVQCDDATTAAFNAAIDKAFSASEEDATYEDQPARRRSGTVDSAAMNALIDELLNLCAPQYSAYMLEYLQFLTTWGNIDSVDVDENGNMIVENDIPEGAFDSFSALLNALEVEITCDYDLVYTESGAGKREYTFHFKAPEQEKFAFPLTVISEDAKRATLTSSFSIEEDGVTVDCSLTGAMNDGKAHLAFSASDNIGNTVSAAFDAAKEANDSISMNVAFDMSVPSEGIPVDLHYAISGVSDARHNGEFDYTLSINAGDVNLGIGFSAAVQDAEIEDRIATAKEKTFSTEEDLQSGSSMLLMRIASLAGDVETLMNDSTISELSAAFNDMVYSNVPSVSYESETAEDLPFRLPEFTVLPEGFELVGEYYSAYNRDDEPCGMAALRYDLPREESDDGFSSSAYYSSGVSITIRGPIDAAKEYSLDADGKLVAAAQPTLESPKITVSSDSYYTVEFTRENLECTLYAYDNVLPLEDLPAFLAGIVWAE